MSDKDFHKLFELVIDELLELAKDDLEKFNTYCLHDSISISEFDDVEPCGGGWSVCWYDEETEHHVQVSFSTKTGTMITSINDDRHEIDVGWGTQYPELKKKFMRLHNGVEYFRDVEKVQEQLDSFYSAVSGVFPNAVDKLIFQGVDDEEEPEEKSSSKSEKSGNN
jgi:hypothetical protein